jgi:hypothetical protein
MILFHYTSLFHLPGIVAAQSINKGDVPISEDKGFQAPWFTTNPDPDKIIIPSNVCKTGARITVAIPDRDSSLIKWTDVITRWRINPAYADVLHKTGGEDSDSWYIYWGVIHSSMWTEVAILGLDNAYHAISPKALSYTDSVPNFAVQINTSEL